MNSKETKKLVTVINLGLGQVRGTVTTAEALRGGSVMVWVKPAGRPLGCVRIDSVGHGFARVSECENVAPSTIEALTDALSQAHILLAPN
jgi:hypothetical protein